MSEANKALIFPRVARNYLKKGFFPTDEVTLSRLLSFFKPCSVDISVCDPCAGEGAALSTLVQYFEQEGAAVSAYGVEIDHDRAYQAKQVLDCCIHGDIQDCIVKHNQFGLLFLNPPYGDLVSDQAQTSSLRQQGRQRLEKLFFDQTVSSLVFGGVLMLLIPSYCLDDAFIQTICRRFTDIRAYRSVDTTYQQVIIMGQRSRVNDNHTAKDSINLLKRYRENGFPEIELQTTPCYQIPQTVVSQPIQYTRLDSEQLGSELKSEPGMWLSFNALFNQNDSALRRPLFKLSDWHLALSLAAGLVSGIVRSNDGLRHILVKGNTIKTQKESVETVVSDSGDVTETVTKTDVFVPRIKAIELTEGHNLGSIFNIQ